MDVANAREVHNTCPFVFRQHKCFNLALERIGYISNCSYSVVHSYSQNLWYPASLVFGSVHVIRQKICGVGT